MRVQHPKIHECTDYKKSYYFFRYWHDEVQPDGSIKTTRKRKICGAMKGKEAISKKRAELIRDEFLKDLNAGTSRVEVAAELPPPPPPPSEPDPGAIIFGNLAEMWRKDYAENPMVRLATPTREKYKARMNKHILPRWKDVRISDMRSKQILDWLQKECTSWHMMIDLRNIMSGVFSRAQEWEILPETYANPMMRVKVGRKWAVRPERILTEEETAQVFARLEDPQLLICEVCVYTGTRISEAVGLMLKHVDLKKGTIRIEQRHCRGDVDTPKTKNSRRTLTLGDLTERFRAWIKLKKITDPNAWIFPQDNTLGPRKHCDGPMWDSGVRKALKKAAADAGCDFPGFGLHAFRRANITWRQEVGGSAIEASKIAGHGSVSMTGDYTHVQLKRQEELTRAIQERMTAARAKAAAEKEHEDEEEAA